MSGFDPDALIDGAAPALGLTIDGESRAGVAQFLRIAADMAAIVDAAPVDDRSLDLAPVFTPISPELKSG